MKNFINKFVKEEKGQGMTEYGLILGGVAVVAVAALAVFGEPLQEKFNTIVQQLTNN